MRVVIETQAHPKPDGPGGHRPTQNAWERFELLYRASRDDVFAYVATLVKDRAAAEDITALAFERAYRRRRTFDRHRGEERAWLFGIARNAALDELRKRSRRAKLEVEPVDETTPGPDEQAERSLQLGEIRRALTQLEPRERDLIALKFVGGLSNTEIARVLQISESNVGTRLHRAVDKLRKACS